MWPWPSDYPGSQSPFICEMRGVTIAPFYPVVAEMKWDKLVPAHCLAHAECSINVCSNYHYCWSYFWKISWLVIIKPMFIFSLPNTSCVLYLRKQTHKCKHTCTQRHRHTHTVISFLVSYTLLGQIQDILISPLAFSASPLTVPVSSHSFLLEPPSGEAQIISLICGPWTNEKTPIVAFDFMLHCVGFS